MALIVLTALVGLAFDGNWPKVLRVTAAFAGYAAALLAGVRSSAAWHHEAESLPLWPFLLAGAVGGALSGLMRPEFDAARLPRGVWVLRLAGRLGLASSGWP